MEEQDDQRAEAPSSSMMEQIRAQYRKLADSQEVLIPLPGYEDFLVVKYRVLDVQKEINDINRRTAREFPDPMISALYSTMDAMARACVEIYAVKGDEQVPLAEAFGPDTPPVRYNKKLAEFMGWDDIEDARSVIMRLFADNEPMILDHGMLLNRWMTNTTRRVNDQFAGGL